MINSSHGGRIWGFCISSSQKGVKNRVRKEISIRDSLTGAGRECIFYEGTTEFCKVAFEAGGKEADALVAAMKEATTDFIATKLADGSGTMKECTQTAMTPGTQPTASPVEYSAGLDAL